MYKPLIATALLLLGGYTLPSAAATDNAPLKLLLVRVTELSAVGPDNQSHTLYHNPAGMLTALRDLGRVTYLVRAGNLPEGGYHTLSVRLADDALILHGDGRKETTSLRTMNIPPERRINGMLWIEAGDVWPQRVAPRRLFKHERRRMDDD